MTVRMPACYLLSVCTGSSLDQQSHNISLFNLVEQINVPPGVEPPPERKIPLEVHCYFRLNAQEIGKEVELRFALVGTSGLETFTDPVTHRAPSPRFRTRTLGVPFPPVLGHYELRVDFRTDGSDWKRDPISWPLSIQEARPHAPPVTH
jgi:hypothetical protein